MGTIICNFSKVTTNSQLVEMVCLLSFNDMLFLVSTCFKGFDFNYNGNILIAGGLCFNLSLLYIFRQIIGSNNNKAGFDRLWFSISNYFNSLFNCIFRLFKCSSVILIRAAAISNLQVVPLYLVLDIWIGFGTSALKSS